MNVWDAQWRRFSVEKALQEVADNFRQHQLYKVLVAHLETSTFPPRILEAGCGAATLSLFLAAMFPIDLYLLDFSDQAVCVAGENARRLGVMHVKIVRGDILCLPFSDNSFDVVYSGGVNEHFSGMDRERAFAEMLRVCKPGGIVLVHVPNSWCLPYRLCKWILEKTGLWRRGLEIPCEINTLSKTLGGQWSVEAAGDTSFLGSFMWCPPLLLIRHTRIGR